MFLAIRSSPPRSWDPQMTIDHLMTGVVRGVGSSDLAQVQELLALDPVVNCFVAARVNIAGTDPWRLGGDLWGYFTDDRLHSLVYVGANLVPIATTSTSRAAFADRLRPLPRRCSSFVGPAEEVQDLWRLLEPAWGPAREVRTNQPFLTLNTPPLVAADDRVRLVELSELDLLVPACVDMFTDEVGISPESGGVGGAYRARIAEIIQSGHALARIDNGEVIFKAEIGSATGAACQVQGVWVAPAYRGRGLAAPGMAAVVNIAQSAIAPNVSLYVNDFNYSARKAYTRVGFAQSETFTSVLF
ncbi:MAG: GNAT family N-acetyltransferase [Candidatus Nanopelagicales bacterium]|nr:GNAT family N-acetyltransferase [Candidatus Nanopelagicales bacterium]